MLFLEGAPVRCVHDLLALNWESGGNQPKSTFRALKAARDLIGVGATLDREDTLPSGLNPQARPRCGWSKLCSHKSRLWNAKCRIALSVW